MKFGKIAFWLGYPLIRLVVNGSTPARAADAMHGALAALNSMVHAYASSGAVPVQDANLLRSANRATETFAESFSSGSRSETFPSTAAPFAFAERSGDPVFVPWFAYRSLPAESFPHSAAPDPAIDCGLPVH